MSSRPSANRPSVKTIRTVSLSALGLGVGLALAACAPGAGASAAGSGSGAAAGVSSGSAVAAVKPSAVKLPAVKPSVAAPTASNSQRVLLNCENQPQVKPAKYELGCDNAIDTLENLHWTTWGAKAVATGTEELNSCDPDCTGASTYYPVTIEVDGDTAVLGNPHVYSEMTITYKGAVPAIGNGQTGGTVTARTAHSWTVKLGYPRG